jgi:cAMP-binding proteins - catabolite gene activator and regulatory subunit of cAMP-dependent protein kinases
MKSCIVCLAELDLFQGLESEQFIKLCKCTVKKRLSKKEILFHQGDSPNTVYLIKSGKLKLVQTTEDGRESILDVCGPGEILGELSLYQNQKELSTAIAIENAYICCFTRQQFRTLIQEDSSFALRIISYLGKKRYENLGKYGEDTRQTVKEKLLYLFYHFAKEYGQRKRSETLIDLVITQQELADMIGASRVMIGQAIKELMAANIIGREKRYYILKEDPCLSIHTFE